MSLLLFAKITKYQTKYEQHLYLMNTIIVKIHQMTFKMKNCIMSKENMRLVILLWILRITTTNSLRGKRANHCPSHHIAIENGSYQWETGSSIKYDCKDGYILYGAKVLYCMQRSWSNRPPKCIINACQDIPVHEPLRVQKEYNGALLRFSCAVMTVLEGTEVITCDGTAWSDSTPMCKPATPAKNCDFENGLCGWDHHDSTDVQWTLYMGSTKSKGTGPEHDHTYGASGQGRYMYFETTSPAGPGDKAILMSPLYPANYSRSCFTFWYHILARGDVAQLQVFIKPDRTNIKDLDAAFSVKENKGEQWLNHILQVPQLGKPFQVVFVATKATSKISDIAIDDVRLYNCPEYFTTTKRTSTNLTTFANPTTSTSVTESVVSTAEPVADTTNSLTDVSSESGLSTAALHSTSAPVSDSVVSTTVPVVDTTDSLSGVSSESGLSSATLSSTSALLPVTPVTEVSSSAVTTVSATTATTKATSQPVKSPVTTKRRTSLRVPLTSTIRSFTNTLPAPLQKNVSLSTVTKYAVTVTDSTKTTDKPLTTPGGHAKHFIAPHKNKSSSEVIYIAVGTGVVILTVIVIAVWAYIRRRRKMSRSRDSVSEAINPLYMAVENDGEDMVNIWNR